MRYSSGTHGAFLMGTCRKTRPRHRPRRAFSNESGIVVVEPHQKSYHLTGSGERTSVVVSTNTGHTLQTDVPQKMGGTDEAPQPVEHLLAALLGCTQATAIYVGRMMRPRLPIERMEFGVSAYRDERGALELPIDKIPEVPAKLQRVSGTVTVHFQKGTEVSREQLAILAEQTETRCPVANMIVASGCEMDVTWLMGTRVG